MPNGRSGVFAVGRSDLERLALDMGSNTLVGYRLLFREDRPVQKAVTVGDLLVAIRGVQSDSLFVEQQDGSWYIIHVDHETETWVTVGEASPLRDALTRLMQGWHQEHA